MYASKAFAFRAPAAWLVTFGLAVTFHLADAGTALAGEGGEPENRHSISKMMASEPVMTQKPAGMAVFPAAAPSGPRWHDKSEEEWRAYHRRDREWKRRNANR